MIDRNRFFAVVRQHFGNLVQAQVDGYNALIDAFERRYSTGGNRRWLAYFLATAKWETNGTMQPVREAYWLSEEWRKTHLRYYPYYGRGYVQLTWEANYRRESQPDRTNIDLVGDPDLALDPKVAADVLMVGMEHGDFGGGGMAHYFNATTDDPIGARHLVNGTDRAAEIAVLYATYVTALVEATV